MPPSKFEANSTLRLLVKRASFSLFTLASSCSNAYFRTYAMIGFLADRLVFLNTVTFDSKKKENQKVLEVCNIINQFRLIAVLLYLAQRQCFEQHTW